MKDKKILAHSPLEQLRGDRLKASADCHFKLVGYIRAINRNSWILLYCVLLHLGYFTVSLNHFTI